MKLNISKWGKFRIVNLFYKLENGKANDGMLDDGDERIYLGAKKNDNGVMRHCASNLELEQDGNCIIFICNGQGSVGYANYMNDTFIGTSDIVAGYCDNMNEFIGEFMATVFCLERPKYSFGRKWKTHLRDTIVRLPMKYNADGTPFIDDNHTYSDDGYVPDWQYMEDYIKSLHHKPLTTQNKSKNAPKLNVKEWEEFKIGDLFDIHPTKAIPNVTASDCVGYGYPLVVNSAENNGIAGMCDLQPTEKGGIITFSDTTDGNTFFYQNDDFIGFSHVQGMYHLSDKWNKYSLLFFTTIIMHECNGKFNYGRKMRRDIISNTYVKLPIQHNTNGTPYIDKTYTYSEKGYVPDWEYMENYIKALPYGDRLDDVKS